jgi:hypothetical protein
MQQDAEMQYYYLRCPVCSNDDTGRKGCSNEDAS